MPIPSADDLATDINSLCSALEQWAAEIEVDKSTPPSAIATRFFHMKMGYQALDQAVKRFYNIYNKVNQQILPQRMEDNDVDMIRVPEIARSFSIRPMVSATMVDKGKGMAWLRERGQGDLIQPTVNAGTLSTFCRSLMLEEGIEPPAEAIAVRTYKNIGINKYTPKEQKR